MKKAQEQLNEGFVLGTRYLVEKALEKGSGGKSYLCRDLNEPKERRIIKILCLAQPTSQMIDSWSRELSLLRRLRHPSLVRLMDFGVLDNTDELFLVEEWFEGKDIYTATEGMATRKVLNIAAELCKTILFLHAQGIVHGDLKPSNAVLTDAGNERGGLKLSDFGLVSFFDTSQRRNDRETLAYMAPELLLGERASPSSDLYSLGILVYQLLARRLPFEDADPGFLIQKHLQGSVDLRPIERLKGGANLVQLLRCLLDKDRTKRPSSGEKIRKLLEDAFAPHYSSADVKELENCFSATRFVGREHEFAFLQECARRVRKSRRGWTVFISGEAGLGKTRCLDEFKGLALLEGWRIIEGFCGGRGDTYGPYRQILAQTSSTEGEAIFHFGGIQQGADSAAFESFSEFAAGHFRDLLTRELVRRLSRCPTVLLLHDFHSADEANSTVLDYLSSDIQAHPILLCVSIRSGEETKGNLRKVMELILRQQRGEALVLEPLAKENIEELVATMTGSPELGHTLGARLFKSIGGNPFFLEEMLKHLAEQRVLLQERGKWKFFPENMERLEVPASVRGVLERRLEQLPPSSRKLANWLALIQRAVAKDLLSTIVPQKPIEMAEALQVLIQRQMVRTETRGDKVTVEFRHAMIAEVIQEKLSKQIRREMHRKIAEVLEREYHAGEHLQELATHCMEARWGEKAVRYALALASQARVEFAHEIALHCFEYVFSDKTRLTREELCRTSIEACDSMLALGMPKRAIQLLKMAMSEGRKIGADLKARMFMQLAFSYQHLGDFRMQEACCKRGLDLFRNSPCTGTNLTKAMLYAELAFGAVQQSHPRRGLTFLNKAIEFCPDPNTSSLAGRIQSLAALLHRVGCSLRPALKASNRAATILSVSGESYLACSAYSTLGAILMGLGRFSPALEKHKHAVSLSAKNRSIIPRAQALGNLAECLCRMGQVQEAANVLERAVRLVSESGNPAISHAFNTIRAEVKLAGNDYRETLRIIEQLGKHSRRSLALYTVGHANYIAASTHFSLGNFEVALRYIDNLRSNETAEAPFYERELAEALRARILSERGAAQKAFNRLCALDRAVTRKRWPYQMCILKLHLAEVLIKQQKPGLAEKYARNALRLARAMPSVSLMSHANLLLGLCHSPVCQGTESCTNGNAETPALSAELSDGDRAIKELQTSYQLIESSGHSETAWRAHAALCLLYKSLSNTSLSLDHAKRAYAHLCKLEDQTPSELLPVFWSTFDRGQTKSGLIGLMDAGRELNRQTESAEAEFQDDERARILLRMSAMVNSIRELNPLLDAILDQLIRATGMECALVFLRDETTGKLQLAKGRTNPLGTPAGTEIVSEAFWEELSEWDHPFVSANAQCDPRLLGKRMLFSSAVGRILCAPLKISGRTLGLLYAHHSLPVEGLNEATINLFAAFCNLSAMAIDNAVAHQLLVREKLDLEQYVHHVREAYPEIVGISVAVETLRDRIAVVAASPLDVLITGESGTGKELVARAIHRTCRRNSGAFVAVDCGSLSDSLAEAELFGYRRGAFTGATENRQGLLESANGGIIFLDEISNLPFQLQAKLLRVLQEREVRRIGETIHRKIDIQVVAATNKDLTEEMRTGRFRRDLYYRLRAMEIRVPSLRERLEDIPHLIRFFLCRTAEVEEGRSKSFSPDAMRLLQQYSYPGNIRELKNIVAGSYYSAAGAIIGVQNLPPEVSREEADLNDSEWGTADGLYRAILEGKGSFENLVKSPFSGRQFGASVVRGVIQRALRDTGGRYRDAFARLRISDNRYSVTMQFLKRNKCYLDFRPYRREQSAQSANEGDS